MTTEQATSKLAEMQAIYDGPPAPVQVTTPRDAELRLAELSANNEWYQKLMAGDIEARRQFDELTQLKALGGIIPDPTPELGETTWSDTGVARRHLIGVADDMRRDGFPNAAIEHILGDGKFTEEAVRAAQHWLPRMERDPNMLCPQGAKWGWPADREYQLKVLRTVAAIGTMDTP
jgi:hypothetical protein